MGCCLSREDDQFDSSNEVLLPKGRNGNKRADKPIDLDPANKDKANGSYKSPSAVVAAADVVPAKPQPLKKPEKSVDLLELDDKPPTPLAAPVSKALSSAKSAPNPSPPYQVASATKSTDSAAAPRLSSLNNKSSLSQPADEEPSPPSKPVQSSLPNEKKTSLKISPVNLTKAEDNAVVPAFTPVSVEAMNANNDDENDDDQENEGNENKGDNDDATGQPKEPKSKKITPTKKSKKKRKKGKR